MEVVIDGEPITPVAEPGESDTPLMAPGVTEMPLVEEKPTPLFSLKERRKEIVSKLFVDLRVPRWSEPEIWVRYKPVSAIAFAGAINERSKKGGDDWSYLANVDVLVQHCIGVFGREYLEGTNEDGTRRDRKFSLKEGAENGPWTKFDMDLAEALGVEISRSEGQSGTCRALYLTEGDVIATVEYLLRWSNISNDEADRNFSTP